MDLNKESFVDFIFIVAAVLSYSWHNADETWQSVEVAHKLVFGTGYLTWEWTNDIVGPIRSYIHPLIFVPVMYLLKIVSLDYYWMIALAPRIQQGIITAFGDYYITKFYELNFGKSNRRWFLLLYTTNVYLLYCGSRTLINTLELNLTCIALYNYSKAIKFYDKKEKSERKESKNSNSPSVIEETSNSSIYEVTYVILISTSFVIRPTTAIFWIPLVLRHLNIICKHHLVIRTLLCKLVPCAFTTLTVAAFIDSLMFGKMVFIPWNFFRVNILNNVSIQYGVEPWYYYLTHTLLPFLHVSSWHVIRGMIKSIPDKNLNNIYLYSIVWTITVLSCLAHKEQRFILPFIPLLLCYAAYFVRKHFNRLSEFDLEKYLESSENPNLTTIKQKISEFENQNNIKTGTAVIIATVNFYALLYLLFCHKVGQTSVVSYLAKDFETHQRDSHHKTNVMFLLPCHSTPLYSHFHLDYPLEFLKCPPVMDTTWKAYADGKDEQDFFFEYPAKWVEKNLGSKSVGNTTKLPSHIVIYDTQADLEVFQTFFRDHDYMKCIDIFNTLMKENERHGNRVHVYCRRKKYISI